MFADRPSPKEANGILGNGKLGNQPKQTCSVLDFFLSKAHLHFHPLV